MCKFKWPLKLEQPRNRGGRGIAAAYIYIIYIDASYRMSKRNRGGNCVKLNI